MILVINCGSSTIKFAVFDCPKLSLMTGGMIESIRSSKPRIIWSDAVEPQSIDVLASGHQPALNAIVDALKHRYPGFAPGGIGHRVVHGGEYFHCAARIDCAVIDRIEELIPLAPLHNPAHLEGIRSLKSLFPGVPQFAVFDTAFHQTMPPAAFRYAIPESYYLHHKIRRYGAHGTSHEFVARQAARILDRPLEELQLITVHLGNGCSACAVRNGKSVDTTMGLTPQEGMMMGTRSGDVDPTLHHYLATITGESLDSISTLLTRRSGLLGVSGSTNDVRELEQRMTGGDKTAQLALELFCYRAAKSLLGIAASLSRIDALIFTAGIGENSAFIRKQICGHLGVLQLALNEPANLANGANTNGVVSESISPAVLVIKTDEELAIAEQTVALLQRGQFVT